MTVQMNFRNSNSYAIKIAENITMTLRKLSDAVAIIFFMDDIENNKIDVPEGFTIYDNTNNVNVSKFTKQYFALCWTDHYTLRYNNVIVLDLISQRTWNMNSPGNRIMTIGV